MEKSVIALAAFFLLGNARAQKPDTPAPPASTKAVNPPSAPHQTFLSALALLVRNSPSQSVFPAEPKKSPIYSNIHFRLEPNEPKQPSHLSKLRVCVNSRKRIL